MIIRLPRKTVALFKRIVVPSVLLFGAAGQAAPAPALRGEAWARHTIDASSRGADGAKLADMDGDGLRDVVTGWEEGNESHISFNPGPLTARDPWPLAVVARESDTEDASPIDLNGDGRLDVLTATEGENRTLFVSLAPEDPGRTREGDAWSTKAVPGTEGKTWWMYSAPYGHGSAVGFISGGKVTPRNRGDSDRHSFLKLFLLDAAGQVASSRLAQVAWLMDLEVYDFDSDGDPDVVYSDRYGKEPGLHWLENTGRLENPVRRRIGPAGIEAMFFARGDLTGNGLEDVALAVRPTSLLILERMNRQGDSWREHRLPWPEGAATAKAVAIGDLDGDGIADLVVSCEKAEGELEGVFWISDPLSDGRQYYRVSGPEGEKYDRIELLDVNGDGALDIITTEERYRGEGMGLIWYENPVGRRD